MNGDAYHDEPKENGSPYNAGEKTTIVLEDDSEFENVNCCRRGWRNFAQQSQHGWVPVYTPKVAIYLMLLLTIVFVAIGIPSLVESINAQELKLRYDDQCLFETTCIVSATLDNQKLIDNINKHDKKLYIYYEIKNQWQNVRRYVDSVSWGQLKGKSVKNSELNRCKPQKYITREPNPIFPDDGISLPCGLQPWSFFNDTFTIQINNNDYEN